MALTTWTIRFWSWRLGQIKIPLLGVQMFYNSNKLNNTWKLKIVLLKRMKKWLLFLIHLKNIEATLVVANKIALVVDFCLFLVCLKVKGVNIVQVGIMMEFPKCKLVQWRNNLKCLTICYHSLNNWSWFVLIEYALR